MIIWKLLALFSPLREFCFKFLSVIKEYIYLFCSLGIHMYRDVQIQHSALKYLYYIMSFIITIKKKISRCQYFYDLILARFVSTKEKIYVLFCSYFQICVEAWFSNSPDLNTSLSYMSSIMWSLYCVFDGRYSVLLITRKLLKFLRV